MPHLKNKSKKRLHESKKWLDKEHTITKTLKPRNSICCEVSFLKKVFVLWVSLQLRSLKKNHGKNSF
jgi:hypothetical protein